MKKKKKKKKITLLPVCRPVTPAPSGAKMHKFSLPRTHTQALMRNLHANHLKALLQPHVQDTKLKKKTKTKKKQTNKNYTFTILPTGNSGSFRRENAKICIVSATHKCAVCSANHPSLCSSCMYMKDTNDEKNF